MTSHPHDDHDHDDEHDHDHGHSHGHRNRLARLLDSVIGHSHDPGDSLDDALTSDARGIRALKISLLALGLTAALQLAVVFMSSSVALLADTVHNFSDALTAIPLWVAFVIGSRAATRRYTFGYRRAEDLAGLFVLLMILASAILAGWESIDRLVHPQTMTNIPAVIVAGFIGFAGNELVALYRIRVGREIGSAALVADGYHARTDGLTSLAVVAGALGVAAGYPLADPLVGLVITAVILVVLKQATSQMLGRLMDAVEPELVDQVEDIAWHVPGVQALGPVRLRWVGHALEASLTITVDCDQTVAEGHAIAEEVRHALLHGVRRLDTALIHVDPCSHHGEDPHAATRHHDHPAIPGAGGPGQQSNIATDARWPVLPASPWSSGATCVASAAAGPVLPASQLPWPLSIGGRSSTPASPLTATMNRVGMAALATRLGRTSSNSGTGSPSFACIGPNGQSPRPTTRAAPSMSSAAALIVRARSRRRVAAQNQT